MRYKGILFDLDGTLLDTNKLIIESFQHTFKVHYNREVDLDVVRAYFGRPLRAALEYLGPDKIDELTRTYREFNAANHDRLTGIFPGVAETIKSLYEQDIRLAVVTSKMQARARKGLELFDLEKYFCTIVGCDNCQKHKPDPEPVQRALNELGLIGEDCLMIGDSPFDLASAKAVGVKTAAVRWTEVPWNFLMEENPDYILDNIKDLLAICEI
ncbi:MAG: ppaX [Firmicutes bacterium]|nr:ppaX [Bacillota bacterium]